jgi:hypothetical protein
MMNTFWQINYWTPAGDLDYSETYLEDAAHTEYKLFVEAVADADAKGAKYTTHTCERGSMRDFDATAVICERLKDLACEQKNDRELVGAWRPEIR